MSELRCADATIEVVHFQRRPAPGQHSMEMLAADLRAAMPADIAIRVRTNRFQRGVLGRVWNMLAAWWVRGKVNHVLGDAHYLATALPSERTIVTVLDCRSLERLSGLRRWVLWLLWFYLPLRRAARITVISEFTKQELLECVDVDPARIQVIPVPVSRAFKPVSNQTERRRPRLLQVGTGSNKNLERVTEAVAELDVELVIIGRLTEDQRRALELNDVVYENAYDLTREEVVEQYRQADAVVFVSTYEGFGMPIVEAQATGRPVVTSNRSPMRETAGGAACLVDPESITDIRAGIERVLYDKELIGRLVRSGFDNAVRFRPTKIASAYATLYRTLEGTRSSAGAARV